MLTHMMNICVLLKSLSTEIWRHADVLKDNGRTHERPDGQPANMMLSAYTIVDRGLKIRPFKMVDVCPPLSDGPEAKSTD